MKYAIGALLIVLCQGTFATKYVFWSDCKRLGYNLADNPGPNLQVEPQNVFEDNIFVKSEVPDAGYHENEYLITIRPDWGGMGYTNNCIFPFAPNCMRGTVAKATMRFEIQETSLGHSEAGTFKFAIGVQDAFCLPYNLQKNDFDNCNRVFGKTIMYSRAWAYVADTISVILPQGLLTNDSVSPLSKVFFEIDVTKPFQWILDHNDSLRTKGYFIRLKGLDGSTGHMWGYAHHPDCIGTAEGVDVNSSFFTKHWTQDGNSLHIVVEGTLNPTTSSENTAPLAPIASLSINPSPFNPSTTIHYAIPSGKSAEITIHSASGALVHKQAVSGRASFSWSVTGLPSGTYYCALRYDNRRICRPVVYLK